MTVLGALMGFFLFGGATLALPAQATAPVAPIEAILPTYSVTLTGYNAVPEQTDDTPFETASGAFSNPEIIAARSQDLAAQLPFGTIIAIEAPASKQESCGYNVVSDTIGYRVIEDSMNKRFTNRIDLLMSAKKEYAGQTKNAGEILGICREVTIRVIGRIDVRTNSIKTQADLARIAKGGSSVLVLK